MSILFLIIVFFRVVRMGILRMRMVNLVKGVIFVFDRNI